MSINNGPEFFEYTIQSDDTLWDLADDLNISVDDIIEANVDLDPENLFVGQIIYLPNDSGINTSQRPGEPGREFRPGRRPEFRPGRRPFRPFRPVTCRRSYVVRPGDTLYRISFRFGVPVREIIEVNPYINFQFPLQIGQIICLPY
jgi:LysM repeat protein